MIRHNVFNGDEWVVDNLFKETLSNLKADIYDAAQNELAEELQNAIRDSVYKRVYAAYHPTLYARRGDKHGLADTSEYITATYGGRTLTTTVEISLPYQTEGGADLVPIIESGVGYTWTNSAIYKQRLARPFLEEAVYDIINDKSAIAAIGEGLIRHGWDIKSPYKRKHTPQRNHKSINSRSTIRAWEDFQEVLAYESSDDF